MSERTETSAKPSLRERRRQRTREEIVTAALTVIAERGLVQATIDRVSAESAVARGTVYAHFPGGRDELLRAAYAQLGRSLVERTVEAVSAAEGWRAQLAAHARALFELATDANIGHFYNVSGPTLITGGIERGIGSGASIVTIRDSLRRAQDQGEVVSAIEAETVASLLVGALREAATGVSDGVRDPELAYRGFLQLIEGLATH